MTKGQLLRSLTPHAVAVFGGKTRSLKMHKVARILERMTVDGLHYYKAEAWIDKDLRHDDLGIDGEKKLIVIGNNWYINWKKVDF